MHITIIHPCVGKVPGRKYMKAWQMEPLPAAYIAGLTPNDIRITFWDDRMEDIDFDRQTDLVAISVETYTAKRAYQIASAFRQRGIPVVMGGFHATLVPDEVSQYAESIVIGEAEERWPQLINDFRKGRLKRVYQNSTRPDISRTMPDRTIFADRKYFPMGLIDASRGCTYQCDFCAVQSFFNASQNWRNLDSVLTEVQRVRNRHKLIFFIDDNIMGRPDLAKSLFEALIPMNIRWISQADISATYDDETLRLMKRSGCQGILIGFESLDNDNLKEMNKGFNAARGGPAEAVKKLHKHGLRLYATFLFGYDRDTLDTFSKTIDFCIDHKIFIAAFNHITPFPGTPLYKRLKDEGRLLYDKWWLDDRYIYGQIPFHSNLPPDVLRENCKKARRIFYGMRSILKRLVNSAHYKPPGVLAAYLFINLILRNDVSMRYSLPLGDSSFKGEIIKVKTSAGILH